MRARLVAVIASSSLLLGVGIGFAAKYQGAASMSFGTSPTRRRLWPR